MSARYLFALDTERNYIMKDDGKDRHRKLVEKVKGEIGEQYSEVRGKVGTDLGRWDADNISLVVLD